MVDLEMLQQLLVVWQLTSEGVRDFIDLFLDFHLPYPVLQQQTLHDYWSIRQFRVNTYQMAHRWEGT